jgi:DNA-directed RNA polymerase specialized sigma24 family protein
VTPEKAFFDARSKRSKANLDKVRATVKARSDKRKLEVDRLRSEGWSAKELARKYGVTTASIYRILREKR